MRNEGEGHRTRYIDSNIGRFLSEDKLRYEAGPNFFKYVDNNPIAFADPYGFRKMPPVPILPPESVVIAAEYWDQFAKGLGKMWANYKAMRNVNTIGVDKYYHCMAHCESASQGPGVRAASQVVSELREDFDYWKGDPPGDSVQDIQANRCGRFGGPDCKGTCRKLAPPWFKP